MPVLAPRPQTTRVGQLKEAAMRYREPGTAPLWWELFGLPIFITACVTWAIAFGALSFLLTSGWTPTF